MTRSGLILLLTSSALILTACDAVPASQKAEPSIQAPAVTTSPAPDTSAPVAMGGPPRGGHTAPEAHADVTPINALPNPFATQTHWAQTYDSTTKWGSVTAMQVAPDGKHIWAANRCSVNSCVGSDVNPVALIAPDGKVVRSFGKGLFAWPHGMDVDADGNVWVTDARSATAPELEKFPTQTNTGHAVFKFSPQGELLMTLGTPGNAGLPPENLNEPNAVLVAPNGNIFVAQGHRAQFVDGFGPDKNDVGNPDAFGRISIFAPDGTFIKNFGDWGYEDGQFRTPHALAMDSKGRLFVSDRGNRRLQIFTQDGDHIDTWYQFSRISGMYISPYDTLYVIDSESSENLNPGWRKGVRIGSAVTGEVKYMIPEHFYNETFGLGGQGAIGEGIAVDTAGNVYAGEIGPPELRGITKFTKVLHSLK